MSAQPEAIAEVRCWEEWLGGETPRQIYQLTQFQGFRDLPEGTYGLCLLAYAQSLLAVNSELLEALKDYVERDKCHAGMSETELCKRACAAIAKVESAS